MTMIPDTVRPTVRDRIMAALVERYEQVQPDGVTRSVAWNHVYADPQPVQSALVGAANLTILDGRETKTAEVGRFRCLLQITTEFRVKLGMGDKPSSMARRVLGEVQATMLSDIYCGGLCLNIVERANELTVGGEKDTEVSGIIFWDVQYRHAVSDPCQQI